MPNIWPTTDNRVAICTSTSLYKCYKLLHISITSTACCPLKAPTHVITTYTCVYTKNLNQIRIECCACSYIKAGHTSEEITNMTDVCLCWLSTTANSARGTQTSCNSVLLYWSTMGCIQLHDSCMKHKWRKYQLQQSVLQSVCLHSCSSCCTFNNYYVSCFTLTSSMT